MSTEWKKAKEYRRIMEILDDYWLSEPNEYSVHIEMCFVKANGEYQTKVISWYNPNIILPSEKTDNMFTIKTVSTMCKSHDKYNELKKDLYEKYHKWMEENNIPILYEVHENGSEYQMVRDLKRLGKDVSGLIENHLHGGTVE